jgi:hypothetical protein
MVQPRLELVGMRDAARVLDISEAGIRFVPGSGICPELGEIVTGRLRFHQRRQLDIAGEVVRVGRNEVGVDLVSPGIPLTVIFSEQQHLMRLYPDGYDPRVWEERDRRARELAEERGRIKIGELEAKFRAMEEANAPMREAPAAPRTSMPQRAEPVEVHVVPRMVDAAARMGAAPDVARIIDVAPPSVARVSSPQQRHATPSASPRSFVSAHQPRLPATSAPAPTSIPVAYLALQSQSVRDSWTRTGAEPPTVMRLGTGEVRDPSSDELAAMRREAEERLAIHQRDYQRMRQLPRGHGRTSLG